MTLSVKDCFNRAETTYDNHAKLQHLTGEKLIQLLQHQHLTGDHLLDLGCGTGFTTLNLVNQFKFKTVYLIDHATKLLNGAIQRLPNATALEVDFDYLPSCDLSVDLIFSNLALHWSRDLVTLLSTLNNLIKPRGLLAFSIPLENSLHNLQPLFAVKHFPSKLALDNQLKTQGWTVIHSHVEKISLRFSDTLSALHSIKKVGANHVDRPLKSGLRGKSFLQNNITTLDYFIGYFIAHA